MSRCRFVALAAFLLVCGLPPAAGLAALQEKTATAQPPKGFKAFLDPEHRLSLYYPKDWKLVAGARDVLVTVVSGNLKAAVVIERQQMAVPTLEITDRLIEYEVKDLRSRQPNPDNVVTSVGKNRPMVMVVDYSRAGIDGPERVRQYSVYEGTLLLRVTCIAAVKDFDKHAVLFETLANSVTIPTRAAGGTDL